MRYVVGMDIGGTKLSVSVASVWESEMRILYKIKRATPREKGYRSALELLATMFRDAIEHCGLVEKQIDSIGISCGGPLDSRSGVVLSPPNLQGWDEVHITDYFIRKFAIPVQLQNDADACALAEWRFGAGRGTRNLVFLTFGTGLGAGLILNGSLYSGTSNMAGEIGHCRSPFLDGIHSGTVGYGKSGSFEGVCSGVGIAELGRMFALEHLQRGEGVLFCPAWDDLAHINAKTIADAAEAGDPTAADIYRYSGRHLGTVAALLTDILNPEIIVIGSIYVRSLGLLQKPMMEIYCRESLGCSRNVCRIVPAQLGEQLGDVAALTTALSCVEENEHVVSLMGND